MLTIHRTPVEAWRDMWGLAMRFPLSRWLAGAVLLPGTPAAAAVRELQRASAPMGALPILGIKKGAPEPPAGQNGGFRVPSV